MTYAINSSVVVLRLISDQINVLVMSAQTTTQNKKIRILGWMDSPASPTGFATVARGVFDRLGASGKYDIDIIGINDRGGYKDPVKFPYKIYPAKMSTAMQGDFFGRDRLVNAILGKDPDIKPPWDIVFTLNDPQILEQNLPIFNTGTMQVLSETQQAYRKKLPPDWHYKIVSYYPVDSKLKANWVENVISLTDYPVAYTEYGKEQIERGDYISQKPSGVAARTEVIYHGADIKNFYPLPDADRAAFRKDFFSGVIKPNTFLVVSVARNQMRKDIPRTMAIFKEFQKRRPDSFLYLHCQETDVWGSLREYARQFNLEFGKDWAVPSKFLSGVGFPVEAMNNIYNAADCIISTSLGEGWGFYNTEGFATKTIVVAPDNTVHPELFGYKSGTDISDMNTLAATEIRGVPMKSGAGLTEWATFGPDDLERIRPLTSVEDGLKKLLWVYDNPDKVKLITDRAYNWVQNNTWEAVADQWDNLFQKVYKGLELERKQAKARQPKADVPTKPTQIHTVR